MADHDFVLMSGAKLHLSSAAFNDANNLRKELLRCVKGVPVETNLMEMDMTKLKDVVVSAAASDAVEEAIFRCLNCASYQNVKVNRSLFDDQQYGDQARKDLLEIYWRAVEVNCGPFFELIFSKFQGLLPKKDVTPKP